MKIEQAIKYGSNLLSLFYDTQTSITEARILLIHALNVNLEYLISNFDSSITKEEFELYSSLLIRRREKEPIAYIIGKKEFYGYEFKVNKHVLIPRPETELLIDIFLKKLDKNNNSKILDLCTGSGCIATTLAKILTNAKLTASDISIDALNIAKENAQYHNLIDRIKFIHSDWFNNINENFDYIVSNPPYISESEIRFLSAETYKYEPHLALFTQENGTFSYQVISQNAKNFLNPNGMLFLEIGFMGFNKINKIFCDQGWILEEIVKDYSGYDRILIYKIK